MEIRPCRLAELLTTEILIQILIRLPLENILVCRGVCKSWNELILQPFFAELHRSFSCPLTIMLVHHSPEPQDLSRTNFGLITSDHSSFGYSLNFTDKVIQNIPDIEIVGSCNGLICLSSDDEGHYRKYYPESWSEDCVRILLCNPILGSHLILPDPPQSPEGGFCTQLGFGYIPSTGEYKAVKLIYMEDERRLSFYVCTIQGCGNMKNKNVPPSASAWREICADDVGRNGRAIALPKLSEFYSYSTFFKGSIIWIAESHSEEECHSLLYFDIEKEEMQTLMLPPTIFRNYDVIDGCNFDAAVRIGVYYDEDGKDHLYLCEELYPCANIWLMEDYESIDSLKQKWVVPLPLEERMPVKLFRVLKDGKLLIGVGDTLAYYDPTTTVLETMKNLQFPMRSYLAVDMPNLLGCLL